MSDTVTEALRTGDTRKVLEFLARSSTSEVNETKQNQEKTLLHHAVEKKNIFNIWLLLNARADLMACDKKVCLRHCGSVCEEMYQCQIVHW